MPTQQQTVPLPVALTMPVLLDVHWRTDGGGKTEGRLKRVVAEAGDGLFVTSKVWRAHHGHAATEGTAT